MSLFHVFTEMFNNQEDAPVLEKECRYVNSTGECSLIQRLKELQTQKKEVDKQIEKYKTNNCSLVDNFIKLLVEMEQSYCFMYCTDRMRHDYGSGIRKEFEYHGTSRLEHALLSFSKNEVQLICNELKELADKANIVAEKQELSKNLADQIKEIKDTLGIE